jgi:predicted nucleotidyltransferase
MNRPPDLLADEILERLTSRGVDFVVVGGIALILHGSARDTLDLDICFATDQANLDALGEVLVGLKAELRDVDDNVPFVPDGEALRKVELSTLSTSAGNLDLLAVPPGAPPYERLRRNADRYDLGGFTVLVASVDDLIAMKNTAGRPKDLNDLAELQAIGRLRRRSES